jgi:hypothetical protein
LSIFTQKKNVELKTKVKKYKEEVVRLKEKIKCQNVNMEEALAQLTVTNFSNNFNEEILVF